MTELPGRVWFAELPPHLRVGGLAKACRDLESALISNGCKVASLESADQPKRHTDIVHFHGLWSWSHLKAANELKQRKIPYVVSPHGMLEPWALRAKAWKKLPYFHMFERRRLQKADRLLATAPQEAARMRQWFAFDRVASIPLATDLKIGADYAAARVRLGWGADERVLVYLSRIHPKKGLKELLLALIAHPELTRKSGRLVIVGDGPQDYVNECQELARRLQQTWTVNWHEAAWDERKWTYLQGADLLCLPTYSENFGLVILEACQVGTPVLTTIETPWQPIADAGFGWVVSPGEQGCYEGLKSFFSQPPADASKRQALIDWTRLHFCWNVVVHQYIELYSTVINEANREGISV